MSNDELPYDRWLEEALRGVIRRALLYTADHGLAGDHHFYITFTTNAPGVEVAPDLRARYPEEMTIVLQHQFWDLTVEEDWFSVTLKFHGRSSQLLVPLAAITAFGDPSVNFGLQLKTLAGEGDEDETGDEIEPPDEEDLTPAPEETGGQVIALDTFRKK
ncbi:MAG: hypothetical protein HWD60_18035 [Defluviicoccus sp.]|nr:MAG: hypothetical protein HWD60_18035 [Defluviicoccus sp.]